MWMVVSFSTFENFQLTALKELNKNNKTGSLYIHKAVCCNNFYLKWKSTQQLVSQSHFLAFKWTLCTERAVMQFIKSLQMCIINVCAYGINMHCAQFIRVLSSTKEMNKSSINLNVYSHCLPLFYSHCLPLFYSHCLPLLVWHLVSILQHLTWLKTQ